MTCSRCGSRYPNPGCYVCAETTDHPETPDREGGSLLKTHEDNRHCIHLLRHPRGLGCRVLPLTCPTQRELMKADTIATICAAFCVALAAVFVAVMASGGTIPALIVIAGLFAFFLFIAITQPC